MKFKKIDYASHLYGYYSPELISPLGYKRFIEVSRMAPGHWDICIVGAESLSTITVLHLSLPFQQAMKVARQEFEKRSGAK